MCWTRLLGLRAAASCVLCAVCLSAGVFLAVGVPGLLRAAWEALGFCGSLGGASPGPVLWGLLVGLLGLLGSSGSFVLGRPVPAFRVALAALWSVFGSSSAPSFAPFFSRAPWGPSLFGGLGIVCMLRVSGECPGIYCICDEVPCINEVVIVRIFWTHFVPKYVKSTIPASPSAFRALEICFKPRQLVRALV